MNPTKTYPAVKSVNELSCPCDLKVFIRVHSILHLSDGDSRPGTTTSDLFEDLRSGKLALIEDWERKPGGTPKRLKYYGGAPRDRKLQTGMLCPVRGYTFTWCPYTRDLTVWALDDNQRSQGIKLTTQAARALTHLIKEQLAAQDC